MSRFPLAVLATLALAACGGDTGNDDDAVYQATITQMNSAKAQAIALAPASTCNAAPQCTSLVFLDTLGHCTVRSYHTYTLAAPTAEAASAAAADERALAIQAASIAPPPDNACVASITLPPTLACVANTCQVAGPN